VSCCLSSGVPQYQSLLECIKSRSHVMSQMEKRGRAALVGHYDILFTADMALHGLCWIWAEKAEQSRA
jgi:hypothetical protein